MFIIFSNPDLLDEMPSSEDLLNYCKLDTLAMLEIHSALIDTIKD